MTPITRQGWVAVGAGAVSIVVARVFGILELFVIGVGFFAAVAVAWAIVMIRRPRLRGGRWIHPMVMVAGDVGRVDIRIEHVGTVPSVSFELSETVGRPRATPYTARLPVPPMAGRAFTITGYELTTTARGIVRLGPLIVEHRDPLGIARTRTLLLDVDEVFVAPRSYLLDMPQLGQGILGAHLLAMARRLGPGEFHGLREYVDGDEPRSIHWKASARSEQLLVKEFTTEGLRRCTVVLDASSSGYGDPEAFERAVTVAASLVHSADRAGLTTRFVTVDGIDLRGPDVAQQTLRHLARLELSDATLGDARTRPGRGARTPHRRRRGIRRPGGTHPRDARSHADGDHRVDRAGAPDARSTSPRDRSASSSRRGTRCSAGADSTSRRRGRDGARHTRPLPGTAERDRSSGRRAPTPPRIRPPGERPAKSFTSDLLASSGLALFSLAVAAGFARVFAGLGVLRRPSR